jgi:hypothetical protein
VGVQIPLSAPQISGKKDKTFFAAYLWVLLPLVASPVHLTSAGRNHFALREFFLALRI